MKRKSKNTIKNVICIVLVVAALAGVFVVLSNRTKAIYPVFAVGSLDLEGKYVESDVSIYTKDLIECQGLSVTPDFESDATYQIFWYNSGEEYLSCTAVLDDVYDSNVPGIAKYCRIVVNPNLEDELEEDKDFKINLLNISKYVAEISIRVSRIQNFVPENLLESAKVKADFIGNTEKSITEDVSYYKNAYIKLKNGDAYSDLYSFSEALTAKTLEGYDEDEFNGYAVVKVNCSNVAEYQFTFDNPNPDVYYEVFFYDSNGVGIEGMKLQVVDKTVHNVEVPSTAEYMCINLVPADLEEGGESVTFKLNEYFLRIYTN